MTFKEWRAAKQLVNISDELVKTYGEGAGFAEGTEQCFLYPGGLVIEICHGRYILQLPGEEEVGDDLGRLERRLYEFAAA